MRELLTWQDVADATGGDAMCVWAAGALGSGGRAWTHAGATLVAAPALARHDRAVVTGPPRTIAALVRHAHAELGPTFRPYGEAPLIAHLCRHLPHLRPLPRFGWMSTPPGLPAPDPGTSAHWLDDPTEVADLLARVFPSSTAHPGVPGVRRWAGIRDAAGRLVATGADAWSAPAVGLIAGVVTDPAARGTGLGTRLCAFLLRTLLAEHGRVALMVDDGNTPATRLYERLGMHYRSVAGCATR